MATSSSSNALMWRRLFRRFEVRGVSLQSQLRDIVVQALAEGFITPGAALPSSRSLALALGLSRTTVSIVLQSMSDQGLIEGRPRSGYYALTGPLNPQAPRRLQADTPDQAAQWDARLKQHPAAQRNIRKPANWQQQPYPFIYGQWDEGLFPFRHWRSCVLESLQAQSVRRWAPDHLDRDEASLLAQVHSRLLPARGIWVERDEILITNEKVLQLVQQNTVLYDKTGEQHYDIVSAFIKSIRGSDPNGAVYWLARMIEGGEDVKFIARRMLILSSEDIGNSNPTAFIMANTTFQAVSTIGYPESRILLSQCAIYLATSPKSNASYMAINQAQQLVKQTGDLPVPIHLRNAPTKLMKELGYGEEYKYSHDFANNFAEQEFLPDEISETLLYNPGNNSRENGTREFLKNRWKDKYGY